MSKGKVVYVCQECGHVESKWLGRCPACSAWNSLVEEPLTLYQPGSGRGNRPIETWGPHAAVQAITAVEPAATARMVTRIKELDRVLGGGIVPASLVLLGGDPGIGKSTLLLQMAQSLSRRQEIGRVLYISGEESVQQLRLRAERLGALSDKLLVYAETDLPPILAQIEATRPACVIVDSIQTLCDPELTAAPGSVGQVRQCAAALLRLAKTSGIPIFLVGHITKAGTLAGPKVLEHMVDTVLYFEGGMHHTYRILRAVKNRFGSTNEIGVFTMEEQGLEGVANPSALFLAERPKQVPGSVVVVGMEGSRPLLVEIQALVGPTPFGGTPRRLVTGVDYNRTAIILAVLEKRLEMRLQGYDVYINAVGGLRLVEPAVDLGIALAVASSFKNRPVAPQMVIMGEVGLAGEVRAVERIVPRVAEAGKLGFATCLIPRANWQSLVGRRAATVEGTGTAGGETKAARQVVAATGEVAATEATGLPELVPVESVSEALEVCFS